jgi:hypothetical protein
MKTLILILAVILSLQAHAASYSHAKIKPCNWSVSVDADNQVWSMAGDTCNQMDTSFLVSTHNPPAKACKKGIGTGLSTFYTCILWPGAATRKKQIRAVLSA